VGTSLVPKIEPCLNPGHATRFEKFTTQGQPSIHFPSPSEPQCSSKILASLLGETYGFTGQNMVPIISSFEANSISYLYDVIDFMPPL